MKYLFWIALFGFVQFARAEQPDENLYAILYVRDHLSQLLKVCVEQDCGMSDDELGWVTTINGLAQMPPEVLFKTSNELAAKKFIKVKDKVWINRDQIFESGDFRLEIANAINLWIEILLDGKKISRIELAAMEYEIDQKYPNLATQLTADLNLTAY